MPVFEHIPLGQRIPDSAHAVSCSLPTMRAVIGYEEKHPEIVQQMTSGYPRFVQHPFLRKAAAHVLRSLNMTGHSLWLTSSVRAAHALREWLKTPSSQIVEQSGLSGVAFPENADTYARAKVFLQHTGMLLSSREAEDYLWRVGELRELHAEPSFEGYAPARVKGAIARAYQHATPDDVFLANSGMNAVYAAFRSAHAIQRAKGRKLWVQLGWLYLDTIAILQKFTDDPRADYHYVNDVFDLPALERLLQTRGSEIAGIITEVPTNPLIQTPDLPALYELCRAHGALLIVDPTIASPLNINVLPYCDVAVNSLTKYAASEGDVIMGAVVVNPAGSHACELRARMPGELEPVYSRDVARLATEIGDFEAVIAQINNSSPRVIEFLQKHPAVSELYWSRQPNSKDNYDKISRGPACVGSMISFALRKPLADFYDKLRLPKGPSFGMKRTLICPFIYLAHYDMVTSEEGRKNLRASGLNPELLRLSVGCEPTEEIIQALDEALS
jgi:cystathionine beta-lyase/cystathionine gamma-synthase